MKAHQISVIKAAFRFLEDGSHDYASRRLVEHFLLHAELGLKVAQVARLVGLDRCTSSRHGPCSPSQVVQAIHNRQAGKFPGKLLPRYAGPVAQFLLEHPKATRDEVTSHPLAGGRRLLSPNQPGELIRGRNAWLSLDEHTVPRWTKRLSIRKDYITTRNKHMRCEKLFYGYDLLSRRFLLLRATSGNVELWDVGVHPDTTRTGGQSARAATGHL